MKRVAKGLLGLAGTMGLVAAAQAGDISRHNDVQNFEIAGFGGWTVGGEFKWDGGGAIVNGELTGTGTRVGLDDHLSFAVAADLRASDSTAYELFYSHEGATQLKVFDGLASTDVSVSYLHLGGTLNLDDTTDTSLYLLNDEVADAARVGQRRDRLDREAGLRLHTRGKGARGRWIDIPGKAAPVFIRGEPAQVVP